MGVLTFKTQLQPRGPAEAGDDVEVIVELDAAPREVEVPVTAMRHSP
jgi:hypothetical protein